MAVRHYRLESYTTRRPLLRQNHFIAQHVEVDDCFFEKEPGAMLNGASRAFASC